MQCFIIRRHNTCYSSLGQGAHSVRTRRLVDCRINLPKGVVTKSFLSSHLSLSLRVRFLLGAAARLSAAGGNEKRLHPPAAPLLLRTNLGAAAANSQGDLRCSSLGKNKHRRARKQCSSKTKFTQRQAWPPVVVCDSHAHVHT
jgi:hypothetical protein